MNKELETKIIEASTRPDGFLIAEFSAKYSASKIRYVINSLKAQNLLVGKTVPSSRGNIRWFATQEACDAYFSRKKEKPAPYIFKPYTPPSRIPARPGSLDFKKIKSKLYPNENYQVSC